MLIEFRVENHRSLRDEQILTLVCGNLGDDADARPRAVAGERLLPAVVLYGANASGKSNVLSALGFMCDAVALSHRLWEPGGGIPRTPFAWGDKRKEPSTFEVSFLLGDTKYEYGFVVSDESVEEEWLYAWPKERKQMWLERDGTEFKFGDNLKGPNELMKEVTRPNALFLSVASQHKHAQLSSIYSWFRNISTVNIERHTSGMPAWRSSYARGMTGPLRPVQSTLFPDMDDDVMTARVRQLLKAADTGVVDIKVDVETDEDDSKRQFRRRRIRLQHQLGNDDSWLDLREESQGTRTLFSMAAPIFFTLESGGLLLVDELESSLHPLLGLAIVRMFNCPETNSKHAQLIFSTHDTNLLGTTLGEPPLRRDQVWFTEKDKDGASKLYPLTDYKPRNSENLERGYLQGRYGAIPFLGDISWITEVTSE